MQRAARPTTAAHAAHRLCGPCIAAHRGRDASSSPRGEGAFRESASSPARRSMHPRSSDVPRTACDRRRDSNATTAARDGRGAESTARSSRRGRAHLRRQSDPVLFDGTCDHPSGISARGRNELPASLAGRRPSPRLAARSWVVPLAAIVLVDAGTEVTSDTRGRECRMCTGRRVPRLGMGRIAGRTRHVTAKRPLIRPSVTIAPLPHGPLSHGVSHCQTQVPGRVGALKVKTTVVTPP